MPGWLSLLSIQLWLRSWSCSLWVWAPHQALSGQHGACFRVCLLSLPFPCSCSLSQKMNIKKKKIELSYDPAISHLGIYPKELKSVSWRYSMFTGVIIHNSQDTETTQMSIYRWMTKKHMVYTYNGILFMGKKKKKKKKEPFFMWFMWLNVEDKDHFFKKYFIYF